jgi:methylated-DNA-[protein]-cysteine S-methyltransferase
LIVGKFGDILNPQPPSSPAFSNVVSQLTAYFKGEPTRFTAKLDLTGATAFQNRVWDVTRKIPYGETRSYRWVAEAAGCPQGFRAVGQALGANPVPLLIPCHRVISSYTGPGGYSGGIWVKEALLRLETAA